MITLRQLTHEYMLTCEHHSQTTKYNKQLSLKFLLDVVSDHWEIPICQLTLEHITNPQKLIKIPNVPGSRRSHITTFMTYIKFKYQKSIYIDFTTEQLVRSTLVQLMHVRITERQDEIMEYTSTLSRVNYYTQMNRKSYSVLTIHKYTHMIVHLLLTFAKRQTFETLQELVDIYLHHFEQLTFLPVLQTKSAQLQYTYRKLLHLLYYVLLKDELIRSSAEKNLTGFIQQLQSQTFLKHINLPTMSLHQQNNESTAATTIPMPILNAMDNYFKNIDHKFNVPLHLIVKFLLTSGMRIQELLNLQWSNVEIFDDKVIIHLMGKFRKQRLVYANDYMVPYIKEWYGTRIDNSYIFRTKLNGMHGWQKVDYNNIYTYWKQMRLHLQRYYVPTIEQSPDLNIWTKDLYIKVINKLTFHDLRATFITMAHQQNCPISNISDTVGHASMSTTLSYITRDSLTSSAKLSKLQFTS